MGAVASAAAVLLKQKQLQCDCVLFVCGGCGGSGGGGGGGS